MSEVMEPIASAVIIPEPDVPISPSTKRRQSSSPDTASKRTKLSQEESADSPATIRASPQALESQRRKSRQGLAEKERSNGAPDRRRSSIQEEKKRGQRLFGGLLSTLSQSTPNGQQKRRLEIEKRQAEKVKQQKIEDEARKAERLTKLKAIRIEEQIKYDEESMRTRHSNLLARANFLSTKSEPKLYYKPWKLLPAQEDRIKVQVAQAESLIGDEQEAFYRQHPTLWPESSAAKRAQERDDASKETVGEPRVESPSASNPETDTTNITAPLPQSEEPKATKEGHEEHNGEVVVEAEEDTVIY
ncbi:pinin/SDK/memA/ protein conserved region-domain-containing protein [Bisporella sp. PMI_857]|nr:pinin/SDK/memA/ protein conserved region-domain-containing protein [Bisporella sp. PMI_857]